MCGKSDDLTLLSSNMKYLRLKNLDLIIDFKVQITNQKKKQRTYTGLILTSSILGTLKETVELMYFDTFPPLGPFIRHLFIVILLIESNACIKYIFGIRQFERDCYKLNELRWVDIKTRGEVRPLCLYYKIITIRESSYLIYNNFSN